MRYTTIDQNIEAIASRQHGVFSRQQAFEVGASERFVQRRLDGDRWVRLLPAVYALPWAPPTWLRQCAAATLSVPGSSLGGRAAAALHQLSGYRPGGIELVVPIHTRCAHPTARIHRYAGAATTRVESIAVTTVAQTVFDLAVRDSPWRLERAIDDAIAAKALTVEQLEERLAHYEGSRRPGLPKIRPLVLDRTADGWTPPESELEALLLRMLARLPSRPRVVRQAALPWRTSQVGRVDALLPDHGLIIEADGRRWHSRVADFDRDRWRDNQAVAHGLRVLRFTWFHLHDLTADTAALIERTIRRAA